MDFLSFLNHFKSSLHVTDIYLYSFLFLIVAFNFKIKPALMSSGVGVYARKDIVLVFSYFYGEIKISALKISLKLDIIDFFCFLDTRFDFFNIF